MKLMLTTLSDELFNIEVADDIDLLNFKALCEFECGIPATQIAILWNGRPLHDDKLKLKDYGIGDGEMLLIQRIQGARGTSSVGGSAPSRNPGMLNIDFGSINIPGSSGQQPTASVPAPPSQDELPEDPAALREMLLASPHDLSILKERNPPLADALLSGSLEKFAEVLQKQQNERIERNRERMRMMTANPFDPDVQKKIAEEIRLKNVETNMETAMEFAPESFGQVVMLYIDCQVNGQPVKAFVDSGAQMTIMSQACARRCHINRLIDTRWAGVAKGVGTQKILGRVHLCQIQIGPDFLQSSFSILEDQPMDMLLGLDMLKRHQCCIDLKRNVLVIGTTGRETPFLGEGDVPEHARLNRTMESGQSSEDQQLAEALQRSEQEASGALPTSGTSASTSSTSSAAAAAAASSGSPSQGSQFPEKDIQQLMSQGFPRAQVVQELGQAGGNVDAALVALLTKSFQMP